MELDDQTLTETGLAAPNPTTTQEVLIIACGALAREILALIDANDWHHITLHCLPAKYHLYPDRIPAEVENFVLKHRAAYHDIFVAYADCGTGGLLQAKCAELGVRMIEGPHCYSFFDGNEKFAARPEEEIHAFYLTDFLVRQFDAFFWRPMGLDRHPELRDMLFANYKTLIYLAQTEDPSLDSLAESAAERLGLAYERRFTGYGDLAGELSALGAPHT